MKKHEFIKRNIRVVKTLCKSGELSTKLILDFQIYQTYLAYKHVRSKMQRYQNVAEDYNLSVQKIMKAVKSMEGNI